jgi:prophage antirepressor-like protein
MSAAIVPFKFDGHEVRTVSINGEPWVNIADVCDILELQNARRTARTLDAEDVHKVSTLAADGKQRRVYFTNEPGVYELTFRSNKPTAKRLKRWLSHEVLPSIRKTGKYDNPAGL